MKSFFDTPTKKLARTATVFDIYQREFHKVMPSEKQYWTLGGPIYDETLKGIRPGSELDQVEKLGLIQRSQFHSIDHDPEVTEANRKIEGASWYQGDFLEVMKFTRKYGTFNPGIINCDLFNMVKIGGEYFSRVMDFLVEADVKECVATGNFVFEKPRFHNDVSFGGDIQAIHEYIANRTGIKKAVANGWEWPTESLKYKSVRDFRRNHMFTFVLWKK